MGTVATICDRARNKIADPKIRFLDKNVLGIVNDILETIYQTLVNVNSNLVYAIGTITTIADTAEYTPSFSFDGFLRNGSWVDGEDVYITQVSEIDKIKWDYSSTTNQPEAFYVTEDGKVGYLWVPDDAYTIYHTYWKPFTALTDYSADDLPWGGIWNRAIGQLVEIELLETANNPQWQKKILRKLSLAKAERDRVISMVYRRGVRRERQVSDMFSIEGI